jgi:hypothetical protein
MVAGVSFVLQALDNVSPNPMHVDGAVLARAGDPETARAELMRLVNNVTFNGARTDLGDPRVRAYRFGSEFVVEVDTPERDSEGRVAPILAYGEPPARPGPEWEAELAAELTQFLESSGRHPGASAPALVARACATVALQPKSRAPRLSRPRIPSPFGGRDDRGREGRSRMNLVPQEPKRRRLIAALTEGDRLLLMSEMDTRRILTSAAVAVVGLPLPPGAAEADPLIGRLDDADLLRSRALLVQSAYNPDEYFDITDASDRMARVKLIHAVMVCQVLGANEVRIEEVIRREGSSEGRWRLGAQSDVGVTAGTASSDLGRFLSEVTLSHAFAGGEPDVKRARRYLKDHRLANDLDLASLVDMVDESNPLRERRVTVTTRTEAERTRELMAGIRVPFAELQAKVDRAVREAVEYRFVFHVLFGRRTS